MRSLFIALGLAILLLLWVAPSLHANATVTVCNSNCICIYWADGGSAWVDVRCPGDSGWVGAGGVPSLQPTDPLAGSGTWGSGTLSSSQALGMPLPAELLPIVDRARNTAKTKIHGERVYDPEFGKNIFVPNDCTKLFWGSQFSDDGYSLLNSYVVFREGSGVHDPNNPDSVPCSEGKAAWTTCCNFSKYVYICGSNFSSQTASHQAMILIHEVMHVAGQLENKTGNQGDTTPPSPGQIDQAVKDACGF